MGRDLTSIRCKFNGKPVLIMTSHLESEKHSSDERKAQFNQVKFEDRARQNRCFTCKMYPSLNASNFQKKNVGARLEIKLVNRLLF